MENNGIDAGKEITNNGNSEHFPFAKLRFTKHQTLDHFLRRMIIMWISDSIELFKSFEGLHKGNANGRETEVLKKT